MANEYIGRKINLGAAVEGTRGTAETVPEYWFRLLAQNHKDKVEYLNALGSQGTIAEFAHAEPDKQWAEGGFDAEIDLDSFGVMLLALLGDVSSEASGNGYLHTFSLDEGANHQALTLFVEEPGRDEAYALACLSELSLNFERGKILDFSANLMSLKGEAVSELTPAFTEYKHFRPKDFHFYLADDIDGLDTANEVYLRSMELSFNKNLEADDVLGLESPKNFLNKIFSTSASVGLLYEDDTYRSLFKAGTPKAMRVELKNPNHIITPAVAASGTFTIVDYSGLTGDTFTVGTVTLTEGVDFDAETSNDVTADNLAEAINAIPNVSAVAVGAVVTVTAATAGVAGNSIGISTNGGADVTVSGANLANGADAVVGYIVFDFARVYFSEYDEDNGRDNLKAQNITLTFAVNNEEADITFGEARILNEVTNYITS